MHAQFGALVDPEAVRPRARDQRAMIERLGGKKRSCGAAHSATVAAGSRGYAYSRRARYHNTIRAGTALAAAYLAIPTATRVICRITGT